MRGALSESCWGGGGVEEFLKELGLKKLLTGGSLGMLRRRLWFWCNVELLNDIHYS